MPNTEKRNNLENKIYTRPKISYSEKVLAGQDKPQNRKQVIVKALAYLGKERIALVGILLIVLMGNLLGLSIPFYISKGIDLISLENFSMNALLRICLFIGSIYIIDTVIQMSQGLLMAKLSQRIIVQFRENLFDKLLHLPLTYFDHVQRGNTMSRISNDIDNISTTLSESTIQFVNAFITVIGSLVMMTLLSPQLTLAVLLTIIMTVGLTRLIASRTAKLFLKRARVLGQFNNYIEETISGEELIKIFSLEEQVQQSFEEKNRELKEISFQAQLYSGLLMPLMNVINNLRITMVAFLGGYLALNGNLTLGVIAAFISYSRRFNRPISELASIFNMVQSALAGAERVFEVLEEKEEIPDDRLQPMDKPLGKVEFQNVSFAYEEGSPVLKNVSFRINPGTKVALVGPTGAGKTTIINLIAKFYEAQEGRVLLDNEDIRGIQRESIQRHIGIVLQDTYLFSGSIKDNISYPSTQVDIQRVIDAAEKAGCHDIIMGLPQGYDTVITESSGLLSQGEKQLISIARTIIKDPAILIMDEATSSVDTRTEKRIQSALPRVLEGRTSFVIAHRLSTIKDADIIMVVKDKTIEESGSHQDLLKNNGNYSKMYHSQFDK